MKFVEKNSDSLHHVLSLESLLEGLESAEAKAPCLWHQKDCDMMTVLEPDLYICGFPCAPYSAQRARKGEPMQHWSQHPQVSTMLKNLNVIKRLRPKSGILENVAGLRDRHSLSSESPLNFVVQQLKEMKYAVETIDADMQT